VPRVGEVGASTNESQGMGEEGEDKIVLLELEGGVREM